MTAKIGEPLPSEGKAGVPEEPKTELKDLSEKVQGIFTILSQETITEESLSPIHEPREGWKQELLATYTHDDLLSCATLLEEAISGCVETAKKLQGTRMGKAEKEFVDAVAILGTGEQTEMIITSLSKEQGPGGTLATLYSAVDLVAKPILALVNIATLPIKSLGARLLASAVNITPLVHAAQIPAVREDIKEKNPWPALIGVAAGLATLVTTTVLTTTIPALAPLGPYAPRVALTVGTAAADIYRMRFWNRKNKKILKGSYKGDISKRVRFIHIGRKLTLQKTGSVSKESLFTIDQRLLNVTKSRLATTPDVRKKLEARILPLNAPSEPSEPVPMELVETEKPPEAMETQKRAQENKKTPKNLGPPNSKKKK